MTGLDAHETTYARDDIDMEDAGPSTAPPRPRTFLPGEWTAGVGVGASVSANVSANAGGAERGAACGSGGGDAV